MSNEKDVCGTTYTASAAMGTARPAASTSTPLGALHVARMVLAYWLHDVRQRVGTPEDEGTLLYPSHRVGCSNLY